MDDDTKYLIDINKDNLARVVSFAGVYDGKAKFVLTLILALIAYFMAELPSYIDAHAKHPTNAWYVVVDLSAVGFLILFLWAVVLIVLTIRPNVTQHSQKASPLFFQSICSTPLEDFRNTMLMLLPNKAIELLAEQTYDNAKVVAKKHAYVHDTINRFLWGLLSFLTFTIGRAILLALMP
jgi:uncharacterized membrane protein